MGLARITEGETGAAHSGNGAVSITIEKKQLYRLAEVRLTLGAVVADLDAFAVRLDSALGAGFDHLLAAPDANEDLAVVKSFRYADPVPPVIFPGDKVTIIWPNAGGVAWAVEIISLD